MFRTLVSKLNHFQLHIAIQSAGTILSQFMPILIAPFLTRLFSPSEFGTYGLVVSVGGILSILLSFRVEQSIIVATDDKKAHLTATTLIVVSIIGTALFSIISATTLSIFSQNRLFENLLVWSVYIPLTGLMSALIRILTLSNNRKKNFTQVSKARISQSILVALISLFLGLLTYTQYGLVLGLLTGNIIYIAILSVNFGSFGRFEFSHFTSMLSANKTFWTFGLPAALTQALATRMPLILFPLFFGLEQAGYLTLAHRVVATPARLIGSAVGEVFFSHAARDFEQTGSCWKSARNVALFLSMIGIVGFGILWVFADPLFTLAFGQAWLPASDFTQILVPMLLLSFIVLPVSFVFHIVSKQNIDLMWQLVFLGATIGSCLIGYQFGQSPTLALTIMSATGTILYVVYFLLIRRFATSKTTSDSYKTKS